MNVLWDYTYTVSLLRVYAAHPILVANFLRFHRLHLVFLETITDKNLK